MNVNIINLMKRDLAQSAGKSLKKFGDLPLHNLEWTKTINP